MIIKAENKSGFGNQTCHITKNTRLGGYVVLIENDDAEKFSGLLAKVASRNVYIDKESAIKAAVKYFKEHKHDKTIVS